MSANTTPFTPGPWEAGHMDAPDGTRHLAIFPLGLSVGHQCSPICLISPLAKCNDKDVSHAHLIAAAPDLLAALQKIAALYDHSGTTIEHANRLYEAKEIAAEAAAKATGRENA